MRGTASVRPNMAIAAATASTAMAFCTRGTARNSTRTPIGWGNSEDHNRGWLPHDYGRTGASLQMRSPASEGALTGPWSLHQGRQVGIFAPSYKRAIWVLRPDYKRTPLDERRAGFATGHPQGGCDSGSEAAPCRTPTIGAFRRLASNELVSPEPAPTLRWSQLMNARQRWPLIWPSTCSKRTAPGCPTLSCSARSSGASRY